MEHSPLNVKLVQLGTALHVAAYRALRGHVPQRWLGKYCILVHTVGRRSGKVRVSPLVFVRDGSDYAIVASWGGSDTHPHWYLNLRANPHVLVEDHGQRVEALASTIDDEATYERLWQRFVEIYPGYEMYKARPTRRTPIVRLRPYDKRQPAAG